MSPLLLLQPIPVITTGITFAIYDSGLDRYSVYPIDVLLLTFMFLRVLLMPRYFSHCVHDLRTDDADAFFSMSKTILDDSFLLKFTMSTSLAAVAGIFVLQIVLYAYTLLMFERTTHEGPLKTWPSAIWLIITTMTTVGYGDIYPTTRMGRVVAISASFSAMAMMAITISLVQRSLAMNRTESKVVWLHQGRALVREKRNCAGQLILATLRVNAERRRCMRQLAEQEEEELADVEAGNAARDMSFSPMRSPAERVSYRPPPPMPTFAANMAPSAGQAVGSLPQVGVPSRLRAVFKAAENTPFCCGFPLPGGPL